MSSNGNMYQFVDIEHIKSLGKYIILMRNPMRVYILDQNNLKLSKIENLCFDDEEDMFKNLRSKIHLSVIKYLKKLDCLFLGSYNAL